MVRDPWDEYDDLIIDIGRDEAREAELEKSLDELRRGIHAKRLKSRQIRASIEGKTTPPPAQRTLSSLADELVEIESAPP